MCFKLFQVYGCDHDETVSTTPCPHAISTGRLIPKFNTATTSKLSRSSSVVSSMISATARRNDVQNLPSQRARDSQPYPSSLSVASPGIQRRQQDGGPLAFRFVAQGQEPLSSPPRYFQLSLTSSAPPTSPTFSTAGTLINQPSMLFTPADPEVEDWWVVHPIHCLNIQQT